MPTSPVAPKRRSASIRLAIVLAVVAFSFYLTMFMLGGT